MTYAGHPTSHPVFFWEIRDVFFVLFPVFLSKLHALNSVISGNSQGVKACCSRHPSFGQLRIWQSWVEYWERSVEHPGAVDTVDSVKKSGVHQLRWRISKT